MERVLAAAVGMAAAALGKAKTMVADFVAWHAELEEERRPILAGRQRKQEAYWEWSRREAARVGGVSTAPPELVETSIARDDRRLAAIGRDTFESRRPACDADIRRRVAEIEQTYDLLTTRMDDLREFQRGYVGFATACGVAVDAAFDDSRIERIAFQEWRARVQRKLNPPPPRPVPKASENPLPSVFD